MLQPEKIQDYFNQISEPHIPVEDLLKRTLFKRVLWLLGIPALLYGVADRGMEIFTKSDVEIADVSYCIIALILLLVWLVIGIAEDHPQSKPSREQALANSADLLTIDSNLIAQQSHRLPFPHSCQIYHLLNLKHLEEIHRFSLGNLKIVEVSHFDKTQTGGRMRFKTMLDSPFNILRMWRLPSVDVDLILHTPYQIELKVPAYRQKLIRVLFNVTPLSLEEHQLSIQIFSDLQWPKDLLRMILLFASSLTLLEDLPYLNQLSKLNIALTNRHTDSTELPQAMQLFQRYVDLYGGYLYRGC